MLPLFICHFKEINSSKKQDAANKSNDCAHAWIIYVNQDVLSLIRVTVAVKLYLQKNIQKFTT